LALFVCVNGNGPYTFPTGWIGGISVPDITCSSVYYSVLTARSDIRRKQNINNLLFGLKEILQLRPISFNWKPEERMPNELQYGFIAQEVETIIPEIVGCDTNNYKHINQNVFNPMLVKSIQELQSQIFDLRAENAELKSSLTSLEARLSAAGF
jgi:hypothetical protein